VKTLNHPRRAVRPHDALNDLDDRCAWCNRRLPHGALCSRGKDPVKGRTVYVCDKCLTPPAMGHYPVELTVED